MAKMKLSTDERNKRARLVKNVSEILYADATQEQKDYLVMLGTQLLVKGSLDEVHYLAMPEMDAQRSLLSYSRRHLQVAMQTDPKTGKPR
jgi:hypothetical protein